MQSGMNVLCQRDGNRFQEAVYATPRIVPSTKATDLFCGVDASFPMTEFAQADGLEKCAAGMAVFYCDALFANKLLIWNYATEVLPDAFPVVDVSCMGCV